MKILIATNNKHKVEEIKRIVMQEAKSDFFFVIPKDLHLDMSPEETALTFEGNAEIKAIAFFNASQFITIADDSGLEIEVLNGLPGVYSARFSLIDNSNFSQEQLLDIDKLNRQKVLNLLGNSKNRNAKFRTVIAYYDGISTQFFTGECCGRIINEERGENGFGYDSIFVPDGYELTFAEMPNEEKNKISHRSKAITAFTMALADLCKK